MLRRAAHCFAVPLEAVRNYSIHRPHGRRWSGVHCCCSQPFCHCHTSYWRDVSRAALCPHQVSQQQPAQWPDAVRPRAAHGSRLHVRYPSCKGSRLASSTSTACMRLHLRSCCVRLPVYIAPCHDVGVRAGRSATISSPVRCPRNLASSRNSTNCGTRQAAMTLCS